MDADAGCGSETERKKIIKWIKQRIFGASAVSHQAEAWRNKALLV